MKTKHFIIRSASINKNISFNHRMYFYKTNEFFHNQTSEFDQTQTQIR